MIAGVLRGFCLVLLAFSSAGVAVADRTRDIDRLAELLAFEETIGIMHLEGLRYGDELAQDMLPDADAANWRKTVARIYDTDKMLKLITQDFHAALEQADLAPMLGYFSGEEGQEVIALEIAARRAFLDPQTEEDARRQFGALKKQDDPMISSIEQVIADSDLVEFNVMGSLNASLMFYRGLSEGGVYEATEAEILADVWSQEEATRVESRDWLGAFLMVAYQPLDPAVLERYAAFYRKPAGRDLNRAIFAAFDRMYEELAYLMGLAVAEHMASEPL